MIVHHTTQHKDCSFSLIQEIIPYTYIIVPVFNEAQVITQVVKELCAQYQHIIVVDDGSTDYTYRMASAQKVTVLRHCVNRGQGAALQTGITYALSQGARYIVTFDGDGQHCVYDIAALLLPLENGICDSVLGSRFLGTATNIPRAKKWCLMCAVLFTRLMTGMQVTDTHNGLRAFTRRAAEKLTLSLDRMAHASECLDQVKAMGYEYCEVPVHVRYTDYSIKKGQSVAQALAIGAQYIGRRLQI